MASLSLVLLGATGYGVRAQDAMAPASGMRAPAGHGAMHVLRRAEAPVSGSFTVKSEGGQQVLSFSSDFRTNAMAPDLKVIVSPSTTPLAASKPPSYPLKPGSYTVLAPLKSASGAQRYVIPASVKLSQQGSLLIWCQKFNATMAWAPLKG